jgi:hypothetical protein
VLVVTDDVKGDNDTYAHVITEDVYKPLYNVLGTSDGKEGRTSYNWLRAVESLHLSKTSCRGAGWT